MPDRYFADRFDADGHFYVFDGGDADQECVGPFWTLSDAELVANNLNTDDGFPGGQTPQEAQRLLMSERGYDTRTFMLGDPEGRE